MLLLFDSNIIDWGNLVDFFGQHNIHRIWYNRHNPVGMLIRLKETDMMDPGL